MRNWREAALAKLRQLDDRVQQLQLAKKGTAPHDHLHDCPVHQRILRAHAEALAAKNG